MRGHWSNDWAKPMERNELFLEPAIREAVCNLLRTFVPDAEVWAYGSRLSGKAHPGSALDLIVRTPGALRQPCPAGEYLRTALCKSDIPIFVDVHDWALLPEPFQKEITSLFLPIQGQTSTLS